MPWENGSALSPPRSLKHMQKCKQLSHIPPEPPTRSPGTRVPPNPFPSLCQAQAAPTAHQQGRAFIPPLPRTGGRQGTYHSAKPRKQQAALTISMCAQRPLINSFFFFPRSHLLCSGPLNPIQQSSELVTMLRHICQIPD